MGGRTRTGPRPCGGAATELGGPRPAGAGGGPGAPPRGLGGAGTDPPLPVVYI
jgi:hypothetical protein